MFGRVDPAMYTRAAVPADAALRLRYLGTAGFVLQAAQHTLVLDPYVSRPGLLRTAFGRLVPDAAALRRWIPRADDVLVGHAHHDHVLDAPLLCQQTGARLIGSPAVACCGRAAGLPEAQILVTTGREDIAVGPGLARGLPSRHGRVYGNRVTLPGDILAPPPWPPRFTDLRHGLVLNWYVELQGLRLVHVDSADFLDAELEDLDRVHGVRSRGVDLLCLCAIGRAWRPGYVREAVLRLRPRRVLPCHWDLFTTPMEREPWLLPRVDLPGMFAEIRAAGSTPCLLPLGGELGLSPP